MTRTFGYRLRTTLQVFICLSLVGSLVWTFRTTDSTPASAQRGEPTLNLAIDVYFPTTGQVTRGPFLDYWFSNQHIGVPVSPPVMHNGHWTQWFEFARLELRDIPFDEATKNHLTFLPIGRVFTTDVGYASRLAAFVSQPEGPDRFFPETGFSIQHGFRIAYETWGIEDELGLPISTEFRVGPKVYQFFEYGALTWSETTPVQRVALGSLDAGLNGRLGAPQPQPEGSIDLGDATIVELSRLLVGERWIDVDLTKRRLTAYVGNYPVLESYVDIGHPNSPTVKGTFTIYLKNRVQTLRGETWDGTPYNEPDVPYVMYFWQDYAIHPSSWRTAFGNATSPGCVIPPLEVAELLWDWAPHGTVVHVHD